VTEADKKAEMLIISSLTACFPEWSFLCEETGLSNEEGFSEYRWIVDPLDGTTSFAHGHPFFSVSIALEKNGLVVLGVVKC
jgi:myo-inositol-1(or 4)-monophosphatase